MPYTVDCQWSVIVRRFFFRFQEVDRLGCIDFSHRMPFLVVGCHFVAAYETVGGIRLQALYRAIDGIYFTVVGDKMRAVASCIGVNLDEFRQK